MTVTDFTALDVIELRRYVMKPGRRDDLIALFERSFIESQEACGMLPIGHFRDLDDPQSFVWFRGFPDMERRRRALEAFYLESRAWLDNRDAANDTMVDSDNVLLLRPARAHSGFNLQGLRREGGGAYVAAAVFMLEEAAPEGLVASFEREVLPDLGRHAGRVVSLVSEERENDFARLPVRREPAFVVAGSCADLHELDRWTARLQVRRLPEALAARTRRAEYLRLEPAARSLYR